MRLFANRYLNSRIALEVFIRGKIETEDKNRQLAESKTFWTEW